MRTNDWKEKIKRPDRILSYFQVEAFSLGIITVSGIFYNIGMVAGPYFEGQMVQCLFDIMKGLKNASAMYHMIAVYLLVILLVQGMRCIKRFFVRRFANNTARNMRHMIYNNLIHKSVLKLQEESTGAMMTKALSDVDSCVEGMRKFTTEIFDTGIVLVAYLVMLFYYDFRLTFIAAGFTLAAYIIAEKLKVIVTKYQSAYKKSEEKLNNATMDRIKNAMTYRIYGREKDRDKAYHKQLKQYSDSAVLANLLNNTMQPLYYIIAMTGVLFIIYFGGKNVMGTGWSVWNIASFTTFLSCFTKMALKSSKAAKLFNAVQKAKVSYYRIKPLLLEYQEEDKHMSVKLDKPMPLEVKNLSFSYQNTKEVLTDINFGAAPGDMIGITGPIGCGKSTLGKVFLCEEDYQGNIFIGERELKTYSPYERSCILTYMGHRPELMSESIAENITLGDDGDLNNILKAVCMEQEINDMAQRENTFAGSGGSSLSGGQQARIALARTLFHAGKLLILDDPFSAVDPDTEAKLMKYLNSIRKDKIIFLISHRLTHFQELSKVIYLNHTITDMGTHDEMMQKNSDYKALFLAQERGQEDEK